MTFWNYFPVFIPKIKNISNNKNLSSIILYFIQELDNDLFPLKAASAIRSAEMEIRKKVDFFIAGKLHLGYSFPEDIESYHRIQLKASHRYFPYTNRSRQ